MGILNVTKTGIALLSCIAFAPAPLAQAATNPAANAPPIRPSKMLTAESAATLPCGASLISFSASDLQFAYGLTDRLQFEIGTAGLNLLPTLNAPLRGQVKASLLSAGPFGLGAGLKGVASPFASGGANAGGTFFVPLSVGLGPKASLNVVPTLAFGAGGSRAGADLGFSYAFAQDWILFAEEHLRNLSSLEHDVLIGGGYGGFGPRTSLGFGILAGGGTAGNPYTLGFGTALHQGF